MELTVDRRFLLVWALSVTEMLNLNMSFSTHHNSPNALSWEVYLCPNPALSFQWLYPLVGYVQVHHDCYPFG